MQPDDQPSETGTTLMEKDDTAQLPAVRSLSILLAEDAEDNRLLIKMFLMKSPHHLEMVNNGLEALKRFQSTPFDLVLMDLQMPVMEGLEATRRIRQWEQQQERDPTPILALTAHAMAGDEQKSLEAGCDGHVTKPISRNKLLKVINSYAQ